MERPAGASLKRLFSFGRPMIERIACGDEVDAEILEILYEGGPEEYYRRTFLLGLAATTLGVTR